MGHLARMQTLPSLGSYMYCVSLFIRKKKREIHIKKINVKLYSFFYLFSVDEGQATTIFADLYVESFGNIQEANMVRIILLL